MQRFKQLLKTHKVTLGLFLTLIVLTGVLAATTYFKPLFLSQTVSRVVSFAQQLSQGEMFKQKSTVKLWIEDKSLKFQFMLALQDQGKMTSFNQRLGIGNSYLDGMSLDLDETTLNSLQNFLPVTLNITVEPDQLTFSSGIVQGFASSLVKETKEFSTGSAKLKLDQYSANEFSLQITDPEPLLTHATASGQFVMSDKLHPLFPILERVGTIEMNVNGKSVNGSLRLK